MTVTPEIAEPRSPAPRPPSPSWPRRASAMGCLLALVAGLLLAGCGTPHVSEPDRFPIGISYGERLESMSPEELADSLDGAVQAHANWIRVDLSWATVQADGPRNWNWSAFDRVVAQARRRGLKVLAVATYSPPWSHAAGCETFTCPPGDPSAFATFARTAAHRYAGRVAAYEIWNEPNLPIFWEHPDPGAYGELLKQATDAIHSQDAQAVVLLGGLSATQLGEGSIKSTDFLAAACQGGRCTGVDGVAYHPYTFPQSPLDTSGAPNNWRQMTRPSSLGPSLTEAMQQSGLDATPIWVTEYGAPTGGDSGSPVSERAQAQLISDAVGAAAADRRIHGLFVYTWQDLGSDTSSPEAHYGLVRTDGSHKPAFDALSDAAQQAQSRR